MQKGRQKNFANFASDKNLLRAHFQNAIAWFVAENFGKIPVVEVSGRGASPYVAVSLT